MTKNSFVAEVTFKDINQKINFELKNIVYRLRANQMSVNTKKMEIVLFRAQKQ